ncbi:hypothetical protein LIER_08182 [Lithospermum erythrorhizon]|uniref:Retrotransposon Copia-like N-terminal domain-containing protein n=1 Tax=Lithospermum erythrorhizon TaxID=34254 RepID=A0AAV3PCB7_LITER
MSGGNCTTLCFCLGPVNGQCLDNPSQVDNGSSSNSSKLDHIPPFYLSSNDNPGNIISSVTFTGHNYDKWSKSLCLSLIARRKFGFIDGSVLKPISGSLVADCTCVQAMLVQWILNTTELSLRKTISYFEEACPLWAVLQRRFDVGSGTRKQ